MATPWGNYERAPVIRLNNLIPNIIPAIDAKIAPATGKASEIELVKEVCTVVNRVVTSEVINNST